MERLIDGKRAVLRFYAKYDTYVTAALKFGLAFFGLFYICRTMGYSPFLAQIPLLVVLAAFCSFLPPGTLLFLGTVYLEIQFYGCSLESALAGGVLLAVFLLLYITFLPRRAYVVILTALCISLKLPLVVPVVCALLFGPGACAGILFGTVLYYMTLRLGQPMGEAVGLGEELLNRVLTLLQTVFLQQELILTLVVLCAVFFVVYLLRRLPVKYSWRIALAAGIAVYCLLMAMGAAMSLVPISVMFVPDLLLAALAGLTAEFFCFHLDYEKVHTLQFEDDDYYYYVKAVPKLDRSEGKEGEPEQEDEEFYLD